MISVWLTTYRRALFLPRTLDSLFAQTERDFELPIADDFVLRAVQKNSSSAEPLFPAACADEHG